MVTITNEFINKGMTANGAWTRAQLKILGVDWPPKHGWKYRIIGNQITDKAAQNFLRLGGIGPLFGGQS